MAHEFVVKHGLISKGAVNASGFDVTADNFVGSASYALNSQTSSWAQNAHTVDNAATATSASYATRASNADSASYSTSNLSSSFAIKAGASDSASYAGSTLSSSFSLTAANADSASYSTNTLTASYALNASNNPASASWASSSFSSSYAYSSSWAGQTVSASFADHAISADTATTVTSASFSDRAITSSYAYSSSWAGQVVSASFADRAISSSYAYSSSWAGRVVSASFATSASSVNNINASGPNVTIGENAGVSSDTIQTSVIIGDNAWNSCAPQLRKSVVIGNSAGAQNDNPNDPMQECIIIGYQAGYNAHDITSSILIGSNAGASTSASRCTLIGTNINNTSPITNAIAIGYTASVTQSNSTVIGNPATTDATIYGLINGTITTASYVSSASYAGFVTSASYADFAKSSSIAGLSNTASYVYKTNVDSVYAVKESWEFVNGPISAVATGSVGGLNYVLADGWGSPTGSISSSAAEASHPGIVLRSPVGLGNTVSWFMPGNAKAVPTGSVVGSDIDSCTIIMQQVSGSYYQSVRVGFFDLVNASNPLNGFYFEKSGSQTLTDATGSNVANSWVCVSRTDNNSTTSISNISSTGSGVWQKFTIKVSGGSNLTYYIDGTSVGSLSMGAASSTGSLCFGLWQMPHTASANISSPALFGIKLDYAELKLNPFSR